MEDEAQQNRLCTPVPFPRTLADYPRMMAVNMSNQFLWGQDATLRQWIRHNRLDAFGRLASEVDKADTEKQTILVRLNTQAQAAAANLPRLMAAAVAGHLCALAPGLPPQIFKPFGYAGHHFVLAFGLGLQLLPTTRKKS